jgi:hypothetical protein
LSIFPSFLASVLNTERRKRRMRERERETEREERQREREGWRQEIFLFHSIIKSDKIFHF